MKNCTKILLFTTMLCAVLADPVTAQSSRRSSRSSSQQQTSTPQQEALQPEHTSIISELSECPDRAEWKRLTAAQRRSVIGRLFNASAQNISDECFYTMVSELFFVDKKLLEDSLYTIFSSRAPKGQFSQELLFSLFRTPQLADNKSLWDKIINIWEAASIRAIHIVFSDNSDGVKIPIADTLYMAFDAIPGRLGAHDLLRFGRVKSLRGDHRAAAWIYCRIATSDARLEHAAMTQMGQLFADIDSAGKAAALGDFSECIFANPGIDTAFFRNWLAEYYGRHGLFEQEIATLKKFDIPAAPTGRRLADAARTHFSRRRYRHAATAAAAAHGSLEESNQRYDIAFVAHQSYMRLGMRDSALVWLQTSEVATRDARVVEAALNQETGHSAEAAVLIDSMLPSISKDTLSVRQHLFSGDPKKALLEVTSSTSPAWRSNLQERLFWRARCLIFSGQVYDALPVLDSIRFAAAWHGAAEILRYKYWIQKLEDDRNAFAQWGQLEYFIYTVNLDTAVRVFGERKLSGESGEILAVRLSRALAGSARFDEALAVLDLLDDVEAGRTPEYLYFRAMVLSEVGFREEARIIANKILKIFPMNIFAQKARILLTRI